MDLTVRETAELLKLPEKSVIRLAKERTLRGYKIYGQYHFNRDELNETILKHKIDVSPDVMALVQSSIPVNLPDLFSRGGIHYGIRGASVADVIRDAVERITTPPDLDKGRIVASLLEREEQMTTGMGEGLALPHPRNPILADITCESVSICFLERSVDFSSVDGKPVHTMFIILSANARRHLEVLSRISNLCRSAQFRELLVSRAQADTIIASIEQLDASRRVQSK
jgi:PTS system nitrogen regulatory IIA component